MKKCSDLFVNTCNQIPLSLQIRARVDGTWRRFFVQGLKASLLLEQNINNFLKKITAAFINFSVMNRVFCLFFKKRKKCVKLNSCSDGIFFPLDAFLSISQQHNQSSPAFLCTAILKKKKNKRFFKTVGNTVTVCFYNVGSHMTSTPPAVDMSTSPLHCTAPCRPVPLCPNQQPVLQLNLNVLFK